MADIYDYLKELTQLEIVFKKNNTPYRLKSYIKSLYEDKILISPPTLKDKTVKVPDNQLIKIMIYTREGLYSGESKILGKEISGISGLWIAYPYNSQHSQRREYLRVPLNIEIDLTVYADSSGSVKKNLQVPIRDISAKGVSYISDEPLLDYFDIDCKIYLKDDITSPIISKCEHIYTRKIAIKGREKYINAFAFLTLKDKDRDRIVKECFRFQLQQKKAKKHL